MGKDEDPEVMDGLMTCITHTLVQKPNGEQDAEVIGLTNMTQEWSNIL